MLTEAGLRPKSQADSPGAGCQPPNPTAPLHSPLQVHQTIIEPPADEAELSHTAGASIRMYTSPLCSQGAAQGGCEGERRGGRGNLHVDPHVTLGSDTTTSRQQEGEERGGSADGGEEAVVHRQEGPWDFEKSRISEFAPPTLRRRPPFSRPRSREHPGKPARQGNPSSLSKLAS